MTEETETVYPFNEELRKEEEKSSLEDDHAELPPNDIVAYNELSAFDFSRTTEEFLRDELAMELNTAHQSIAHHTARIHHHPVLPIPIVEAYFEQSVPYGADMIYGSIRYAEYGIPRHPIRSEKHRILDRSLSNRFDEK